MTDEPDHVKIQCLLTTKGRGMFCVDDVAEASLVHKEDPFAAVQAKTSPFTMSTIYFILAVVGLACMHLN